MDWNDWDGEGDFFGQLRPGVQAPAPAPTPAPAPAPSVIKKDKKPDSAGGFDFSQKILGLPLWSLLVAGSGALIFILFLII